MGFLKRTYNEVRSYSTIEKIQLTLMLLFVTTLTSDTRLNSSFLVIFVISLLPSFKRVNYLKNRSTILLYISIFVMALISFAYSTNTHEAKLVLERQLSLLFIPLVFFSCFRITEISFRLIIRVYFISIVAVSAYLLKCSTEHYLFSKVPFHEWFVRDNLYHAFAMPIKMHATYLSLYVAIGIFIGFNELFSKNKWSIKILFFIAVILLVITLTLLSSRAVISSVALIIFLIYPFFIWELKQKFILVIAGGAVFFTIFFVMRESSFIRNRFSEKINDEFKMTSFLQADSTYNPIYGGETRADRWYCAVELIKERPLLGYGTGNEKSELMRKYKKYNLQNAIVNHYDAHNQYLAFAIKSGIMGLLIFIVMIVYMIYVAIKRKSFLYLSFVLLLAIACITEDVLESNKGIFFFAFFNSMLACYTLANRTEVQKQSSE
jgi:O-antigen ligase